MNNLIIKLVLLTKKQIIVDKKVVGKSKAEQMTERQQELERRLQDVTGQLGSSKKSAKKGKKNLPSNSKTINCD